MTPQRIQLSRAKGFRLQQASHALNGLPAMKVSRPGKWGNPFKVAPAFSSDGCTFPAITAESAVVLYREWIERALECWPSTRDALAELRGKNLACWCKPGAPCHADVLLELANGPAESAA